VQFVNSTSSLTEDGIFIDVCVAITNPSATVATNVDIELDVSSTATNGTDYDDGAGTPMAIAFPQTLTFPANSSTDECLTVFISNDDLLYEGDETVVLNVTNATGVTSATLGGTTQHVLTILDNETPVLADVVITEIMYNTPGIDDEWIEVCNTTGITQVLNNYTVRVNGTIEVTFPSTGATIGAGDCITIGLGDDGDAEFNDGNGTVAGGYCPFTPEYTNGSGPGTLANSGATITIIADDNSTVVDTVTYSNAAGAAGNGASLHVTDDSLDNSNTASNWQEVIDGGSPGLNTLVSQCSPLEPEINVESGVSPFPNISNGAAASGLFNTQFSTNIDIITGSETRSYRIQNIGTDDLDVTDIQILGAHPGDFTVSSPAVLNFTVGNISTGSNVVVFDVTFDPTAVGTRNAIVSIDNNDTTDGEDPFQFNVSGGGHAITSQINRNRKSSFHRIGIVVNHHV
ncbi:MAG: lamin tail domain-containing protein, partial [Psychroserpens sp.]|nr:lamin tail domain-containing protein [Psychroserpens sp.]